MFIAIPLISFLFFWIGFYQKNRHGLLAFLYAAALWGGIVWFLTESFSLFHILSFVPLVIAWALILLVSGCWAVPFCKALDYRSLIQWFKLLTLTEKSVLVLIIIIAVLKGISAIYSAPNTSDAMTYHLNRVEHWIQNHTVADFPSHVTRELYSPPWAEYAILNLRILSHGDYFSNAVQWFSAIGSWAIVAGLSQLLGANLLGQLFAVFLAASLPVSLVQATSMQTDYVMTFWVAGFVYLLWVMYLKPGWRIAVAAGMYLGLALLTKGNAYLFTPIWIVVYIIANKMTGNLHRLKLLALIILFAFIINLPYVMRNNSTFSSPYWTYAPLVNQRMSFPLLGSSMATNLAFHTNIFKVSEGHVVIRGQSTGEDDTVNELYIILLLGVLACLIFYRPLKHKVFLVYAICIIGMFVIFSAVVKYNPFNSRFHLGVFILSTALVGRVLIRWLPHRVVAGAAVLIFLSSWSWLFKCNEHSLIGDKNIFVTSRSQQYFSTRPYLFYPYVLTTKVIASGSCRDIGLISDENEWGYPWWVFLRDNFGDNFRLEDVGVENLSSSLAYPLGKFEPCALIASDDERTVINLNNGIYARVWYLQLPGQLTSVFTRVH